MASAIGQGGLGVLDTMMAAPQATISRLPFAVANDDALRDSIEIGHLREVGLLGKRRMIP
ncbi:MAG: hypothetical protein ACRDS9_08585 [Pseudonocardiaceae bacterium]